MNLMYSMTSLRLWTVASTRFFRVLMMIFFWVGMALFFLGVLLVWNCSPCWTCLQVEWSGQAFFMGGLWIVRMLACCYGAACRGR